MKLPFYKVLKQQKQLVLQRNLWNRITFTHNETSKMVPKNILFSWQFYLMEVIRKFHCSRYPKVTTDTVDSVQCEQPFNMVKIASPQFQYTQKKILKKFPYVGI